MKIYTKVGDLGQTKLNNELKNKNENIFHLFGQIDMAQSVLGLLHDEVKALDSILSTDLIKIIKTKYLLSSALYYNKDIEEDLSNWLEIKIDNYDLLLKPLSEFILPIGKRGVAMCHYARTNVRKLEREFVNYILESNLDKNSYTNIFKYLNRLSDYLFTVSRYLNEVL